jgi:hypothetical protein
LELQPESGWFNGNFSGEQTITFRNVPTALFSKNSQQINAALYSMRKMNDITALPPKLIKPTPKYANPYGVYVIDNGHSSLASYQDALNAALLDVVSALKQAESVHKYLSSAHNQLISKMSTQSDLGAILGDLKDYDEGLRMTQGILTNAADYFQKDSDITYFLGELAKQGKSVETIRKFLNGEYVHDMSIPVPASYTELKQFILRKLPGMEDDKFEPKDFFTIVAKISKDAPAPLKAVFEPLFTVGSAFLDEISDIQKLLFDIDAQFIGLNDGQHHIRIEVKNKSGKKFNSDEIAGSIKSVKIISNLSPAGDGHSAYMDYKFNDNVNNNFAEYDRTFNSLSGLGGSVYCSQIQILWKNGRVTWVPVSSKFVSYDYTTHTIFVKFKSENSLAKHLSDKLTIQPPNWW